MLVLDTGPDSQGNVSAALEGDGQGIPTLALLYHVARLVAREKLGPGVIGSSRRTARMRLGPHDDPEVSLSRPSTLRWPSTRHASLSAEESLHGMMQQRDKQQEGHYAIR